MPDTPRVDPAFTLEELGRTAHELEGAGKRAGALRVYRDVLIRRLYVAGTPTRRIAEVAGVSRATVQRICDLAREVKR